MRKSLWALMALVMICSAGKAQTYPQDYFRNPLDISITLAGSFGELRFNHFHSGMDIRTNGVEGLPVYAAADGWISRINVSASSYGNAIYITHPNGYTTLYAHMKRFREDIQAYVRKEQYRTESFEQELHPDSERFQVRKGQLIGYSGNTGASRAPHVHFEVRETLTEAAVNPMLFFRGQIADNLPPSIKGIKIYPLDSHSFVRIIYRKSGRRSEAAYGQSLAVDVVKGKNGFALSNVSKIEASGTIGFGIRAVDYFVDYASTLAPYSIDLDINGKRSYHQTIEKVEFAKQRYINAHMDYAEVVKHNRWYERSFLLPNDSLRIYSGSRDGGKIPVKGDKIQVEYIVKDMNDSTARLAFSVFHASGPTPAPQEEKKENDSVLCFDVPNEVTMENFRICIPKRALYDNMAFSYKTAPQPMKAYSDIYKVGDAYTPFHLDCEVSIKGDKVPDNLRGKACILSSMRGYLGGYYEGDWLKAKTKSLGSFYIVTDTFPPSIRPVNIKEGSHFGTKGTINFHISDNLSGIKSYRGTIDGKWVLFQFDAKKAHLWYEFDQPFEAGEHTLELTVSDMKNNVKKVSYHFYKG